MDDVQDIDLSTSTLDPTPKKPNLEFTLAQQANEAIKAGGDPHAVTERLHTMLTHVRANPAISAQGSSALAAGADPSDISSRVWQLASSGSTPPIVADVPPKGVVSRAADMVGEGLKELVTHPIDTVSGAVKSAVEAPITTMSPGVGEARPDARLSKGGNSTGRPIDTSPYDAEHGGVTSRQRTVAGLQTIANIATPAAFSAVKDAVAPIAGATTARIAAGGVTGAAQGAVHTPNDPGAGALAGGVLAPLVGETARAATKPLNLAAVAAKAKMAPDAGESLPQIAKERAAVSGPLYDQFRQLGDLGHTPSLDALIGDGKQNAGLPIVRRAIETVKGESPTLANLPDTHAAVLDAAAKRVGSKAFATLHGYEAGEANAAFRNAIDDAAQAKGGTYLEPVEAFREGSQAINAVQRGRDVMKQSLSKTGGTKKDAMTRSPTAFADWFSGASPDEQTKAIEGVYGDVGRRGVMRLRPVLGTNILPTPSAALLRGADLLERVGRSPITPSAVDGFQRVGAPIVTGAALADALRQRPRRRL